MICRKTHTEYTNKCCFDDLCVYHEITDISNRNYSNLCRWIEEGSICKMMIPFIKNKIRELESIQA
jgi:hypothetical protein